jgi:hypothetical protein
VDTVCLGDGLDLHDDGILHDEIHPTGARKLHMSVHEWQRLLTLET